MGRQKNSVWSQDEMDQVIKIFYDTGDYSQCLSLINADIDPLFAIQHALGLANRRVERDAFEDISYEICNRRDKPGRFQDFLKKIKKGINDEYGPLAVRILESKLPFLVSGILKGLQKIPPVNCIVALMGIEAQKMADMTIPADRGVFGKTLSYYSVKCKICGGKGGGEGYILCSTCLSKAKNQSSDYLIIVDGHSRKPLELVDIEEREAFIRNILISQSDHFGCSNCAYKPVKRCECAKEVSIPQNPSDGKIIKGKYLLTGKDWICCIRHK